MIKKILLISLLFISTISYAKNSISKKTYNSLTKAQELISKNSHKKAENILKKLLQEDKNAYEKSFILQSLSNIYLHYGHYKKVANTFEEIIKLKAFEEENLEKIKFSLSKIYLSDERYEKSIALSKSILNSKNIKKHEVYENLILGYYYGKQYKNSVNYSKKYFSTTKRKLDESWYKIFYSSYIELRDYNNAIKIMEKMVRKFNKNEQYWIQLASLYQRQKRLKKSLATLELAYKSSILTTKDNKLYFINILLQNRVYKKASKLLAQAINNNLIKEDQKTFELLVSSYINAKDHDLAIKRIENSQFKNINKYRLLLANLYYQKQNFQKSIKVLNNLKTKTNSRIDGDRKILMALCYYELDNKNKSIKILQQVVNNPYHKREAKSILEQLKS